MTRCNAEDLTSEIISEIATILQVDKNSIIVNDKTTSPDGYVVKGNAVYIIEHMRVDSSDLIKNQSYKRRAGIEKEIN